MTIRRRPFFGAAVLAVFITGCLALMVNNLGRPLEAWLLFLIFAAAMIAIYEVAVKLLKSADSLTTPASNRHDEFSES